MSKPHHIHAAIRKVKLEAISSHVIPASWSNTATGLLPVCNLGPELYKRIEDLLASALEEKTVPDSLLLPDCGKLQDQELQQCIISLSQRRPGKCGS